MRQSVELITPKMAAKYLEKNTNNRSLREKYAERLAQAMRDGQWLATGQPIIFLSDGTVGDGQHRLKAIVISGISLKTAVVRGVTKEAMKAIDTGHSRSAADVVEIVRGDKNNPKLAAAAAGCLYRYVRGFPLRAAGMSTHNATAIDVLNVLDEHPGLRECAKEGYSLYSILKSISVSPSFATFFVYAARLFDRDLADEFVSQVASGEGLKTGDVTYVLREYAARRASTRERLPAQIGNSMLVKAWNAYATGTPMKRAGYKASEGTPFIYGCPLNPKIEEPAT